MARDEVTQLLWNHVRTGVDRLRKHRGFRHWLEIASSLGPANDLVGPSLLLTTQLIDASRPSCRSRKVLRSPPWGLCYIDVNGHLELLWKCLGTTLWDLMVPPLLPFPLQRARSISPLRLGAYSLMCINFSGLFEVRLRQSRP